MGSRLNPEMVDRPLEKAIENLESMQFVGVVEHYQASLCVFAALAAPKAPLPVFCNCTDTEAWSSFKSKREDFGLPKHSFTDITAEEHELLDQLVKDDLILYGAAKKIFQRQARAVEEKRKVRLLC